MAGDGSNQSVLRVNWRCLLLASWKKKSPGKHTDTDGAPLAAPCQESVSVPLGHINTTRFFLPPVTL